MKFRLFFISFSFLTVSFFVVPNANGQWVNVGLFGRSSKLVVSGTNLFANETMWDSLHPVASIFHSTDSGATWNPFGTIPNSSYDFNIIAVLGTTLFAQDRGFNYIGFRSTDSGRTWTVDSILNAFDAFDVVGGSGTSAMMFTFDYYFSRLGNYYSIDSGNSWIECEDSGLDDAHNAITGGFAMIGTNILAGSLFEGVYVSTDTGRSWTKRNDGLTSLDINVFAIDGSEIFVGCNNGPFYNGGVFLSTDSGNSWKSVSNGLPQSVVFNITALVGSENDIFAGTNDSGVYLSTDSGANWSNASEGLTDGSIYTLAVADGYLFAATDSGIWRRPLSDFNQSSVSESTAANSGRNIQVFPNPASGPATISLEGVPSADVEIFDVLGREVDRFRVEGSYEWETGGLPRGTYIVRANANGPGNPQPITKRIVKE